ncbi:MAG: PAS domain S-box protein, partial [Syntrophomonadaceae bacterium]|nr:PAS domain S-box protein [Syntrophomonadaceae bacterium]
MSKQIWVPEEHRPHKHSEQLNQMILDNAHDLIAIHKMSDLSYEYANPATIKTLGYSSEELLKSNVLELIHPEDLERVLNVLKEKLPLGRGQADYRYRRKDGSYVWLEATGTLLPREDEPAMIIISRDITERKLMEEALLNSELRYRMVVEDQTELIGRCQPDLTITFVNQALCDAFGKSAEELKGKSFLTLLPEANHAGTREFLSQFTANNSVMSLTNPSIRPTGEVKWLEWTTRAIFDESGQIVEYQGVARDVTDQKNLQAQLQNYQDELEDKVRERTEQLKQANKKLKALIKKQHLTEAALKESENYYRTIFENAGTATVIVDKNLRITAANPKTEELCGYKPEEIVGQNPFEKFVAPEYLALVEEIYQQRHLDSNLAPQNYEIVGLDRDGRPKNLVMNVKRIPDSESLVVSILDITQQHQARQRLEESEKRFRTLFEKAPIGILINKNGAILEANQAYAAMFGYENTQDLIGTSVMKQVAPSWQQEIAERISQREKGLRSTDAHEMVGQRKDGSVFPVFAHVNTVRLLDGPVNVVFYSDISAQKQVEAALSSQVKAQNILLDISKQFGNIVTYNIDAMINLALKQIGEFDHSDRCYVFLFSEDGSLMSNTHEWCAEGIKPEIDNLQNLPTAGFPWWMAKLQKRENIYIPRIADLPPEAQAEKEILEEQDIQSLFIAPMVTDDKLVGYIGFDSVKKQRCWSPENIVILESVASIIAKGLQRKAYAEALETSENYYRTIFENTGAPSMIIEADGTISTANAQCERLLHYSPQDLIGRQLTEFIPARWKQQVTDYHVLRRANPEEVPKQYEMQMIDGYERCRDGIFQVDLIPGTSKTIVTFIDTTDYRRIDRALKAVSNINAAIVHTDNEQELLDLVCQNFVETGGYKMAWIGYLLDTPEQKVKPMASAGHNHGYTHKLNISLKDPKRNTGPAALAIRSRLPQVCRDIKTDPDFKPWAKDALRRGFRACMALPLVEGKKAFGVVGLYSDDLAVFNHAEEHLLTEMGENLSFAISALRARQNIQQATEDLEKSL